MDKSNKKKPDITFVDDVDIATIKRKLDKKQLTLKEAVEKYKLTPKIVFTKLRRLANLPLDQSIFTKEQEKALKEHIIKCSKVQYNFTIATMRSITYEYAVKLPFCKYPKKWDIQKMASMEWFQRFRARHSDLKSITTKKKNSCICIMGCHMGAEGINKLKQLEARVLIARVYHYLHKEYEYMKMTNDLSLLLNILRRTAEATGVCEQTITSILDEEQKVQHSLDEVPPVLKVRKKRKNDIVMSEHNYTNKGNYKNGDDGESTKASTTEAQTITSRKRKKSNAQKCREYREKRKLQNTEQNTAAERSDGCSETDQLPAKKIPKTDAERSKKYYEAQKLKRQKIKKIPKTAKQRNRECYYRKKKLRALNILNHHSDVSETDSSNKDTNTDNNEISKTDKNLDLSSNMDANNKDENTDSNDNSDNNAVPCTVVDVNVDQTIVEDSTHSNDNSETMVFSNIESNVNSIVEVTHTENHDISANFPYSDINSNMDTVFEVSDSDCDEEMAYSAMYTDFERLQQGSSSIKSIQVEIMEDDDEIDINLEAKPTMEEALIETCKQNENTDAEPKLEVALVEVEEKHDVNPISVMDAMPIQIVPVEDINNDVKQDPDVDTMTVEIIPVELCEQAVAANGSMKVSLFTVKPNEIPNAEEISEKIEKEETINVEDDDNDDDNTFDIQRDPRSLLRNTRSLFYTSKYYSNKLKKVGTSGNR